MNRYIIDDTIASLKVQKAKYFTYSNLYFERQKYRAFPINFFFLNIKIMPLPADRQWVVTGRQRVAIHEQSTYTTSLSVTDQI